MSIYPDTSISAYDQVTPEALRDIYDKILGALKVLGKANYEMIATQLQLPDRNMVSRRLKEMMEMKPALIYKPGSKSMTTRKRNAYDYAIMSIDTVVPDLQKITKGVPSAADYANKIIASTSKGIKTQAKLFKEDQP